MDHIIWWIFRNEFSNFVDFEMFLSISVYWMIQLFCRFQIDPLLLIHQSIQYDLFHVAFHSASAQSKLSFYHQGSTDRQPVWSCSDSELVQDFSNFPVPRARPQSILVRESLPIIYKRRIYSKSILNTFNPFTYHHDSKSNIVEVLHHRT